MNAGAATRRSRAAWWAALFGFAATLWLFYPGFASFDTAHQWYEVRHGRYTDHHPPLMALLWSLTEPVLPGPAGPFVMQALLYWGALGAIAFTLFRRWWSQTAAVLLVGLAPPLFALLAHVWKDVALMTWLMAATALLVIERQASSRHRALLVAAAVLIAGAAAFRHNGIAAALPLAIYIAWRWHAAAPARRTGRIAITAALVFAAVAVLSQLPARHPRVEHVQFWPTLALWDLAAVSIAEQRMLIPPELHKRPLAVADLEPHFRPDNNVSLYAPDLLRISLIEPYSDDQSRTLLRSWLSLPARHPLAYFGHRWRLFRTLIGWPPPGVPPPQDFMSGYVQFKDNPPLSPPQWPLRDTLSEAYLKLSGTIALAAWPWLLLSLPLTIMLWLRRQREHAALGLALVVSAWCYLVPLAVLAGSAELRYLSWTLAAMAMALLTACADTRPNAIDCGAPGERIKAFPA